MFPFPSFDAPVKENVKSGYATLPTPANRIHQHLSAVAYWLVRISLQGISVKLAKLIV